MNLGFDIIFFSTIASCIVACFMLGEEKAQRLVIGTLVGILAGLELSQPIEKLLSPRASFLTQPSIAIILLAICVLACVAGRNVRDARWPKSKIKATIAGGLSAVAILGYVLASLSANSLSLLVTDHNLAAIAYDLRYWALAGLIVWLLVSYVNVGKAKR